MRKLTNNIPRFIMYAFMIALAVIYLYPFLYMITTSLMTNDDLNNYTVKWIPRTLNFNNYVLAANITKYFNNFKNTLLVTVLSLIGQLLACSLTGYALARFEFPAKKAISFIVILAMIVPVQTIVVPKYLFYSKIGWLNTFFPLIVPCWLGYGINGALFIFIFRQFYAGLPKNVEEAAKVDGCGYLKTFFLVVFPMARSSYLVVTVLGCVWHWSNYYEPSIFIAQTNKAMVSSGLENLFSVLRQSADIMANSYSVTDENALNDAVLMAGAFLVVIPVLIVFSVLQKQFIQGIEHTGLTGE